MTEQDPYAAVGGAYVIVDGLRVPDPREQPAPPSDADPGDEAPAE